MKIKSTSLLIILIGIMHMLISCGNTEEINSNLQDTSDSVFIVAQFNNATLQPANAKTYIDSAFNKVKKQEILNEIFQFNLARFYIQTGNKIAADSIINLKLDTSDALQNNYANAKYHNLKAAIAAYNHNQEQAVHHFKKALEIYSTHADIKQQGYIQFNLANIFFSRLDYSSVLDYILQSKTSFIEIGDTTFLPVVLGIQAIAEIKLGKDKSAASTINECKELSTKYQNKLGLLLLQYANGEMALNNDQYENAVNYFKNAIQYAQTNKVHQIDLPLQAALLSALINAKHYNDAIKVGEEALSIANATNNLQIQYNIYKNLSVAYKSIGQFDIALDYIYKAEDIFKKNTIENNQKKLHELLIQYDTEKKNNIILTQKNSINNQRTLLLIIGGLLFLAIILIIAIRKIAQSKKKLLVQKNYIDIQKAIVAGEEKERIRLANELHDGIAANIYAIKLQIEQTNHDKSLDQTLTLVKDTHTEIRKVAHNLIPIDFNQENLLQRIKNFASENQTAETEISFYSNITTLDIPNHHALILYRFIQECLQNALKHADATLISLHIIVNENNLLVKIQDDGKGIDINYIRSNNKGIYKFKDRLAHIGAIATVESDENGTEIMLKYKL